MAGGEPDDAESRMIRHWLRIADEFVRVDRQAGKKGGERVSRPARPRAGAKPAPQDRREKGPTAGER